jgi:hypothetical protein
MNCNDKHVQNSILHFSPTMRPNIVVHRVTSAINKLFRICGILNIELNKDISEIKRQILIDLSNELIMPQICEAAI